MSSASYAVTYTSIYIDSELERVFWGADEELSDRAVMSSASYAVTYTSIYIDSELERVFWGADEELSDRGSSRVIVYEYDGLPMRPVAPPSPDYIPGPKEPQTPPVPQDEDEHLEEYENDEIEYGPVDYPIDGADDGDDDDGDSSGDDTDDKDKDEENKEEGGT
nr:hypothetical protein [Tanacetum cinerariifolium]